MGRKREKLEGQKFGKLTVLTYDEDLKMYLCECDCGNRVYRSPFALKKNKYQHCGCEYLVNRKKAQFIDNIKDPSPRSDLRKSRNIQAKAPLA